MNILSPLKIAYKALQLHKVRSVLTILGLVIGVTAIIVVMNMGMGIENFILKQMEIFGSDYVEVEIKVPSTSKTSTSNATGIAQGISITTLKLQDAKAIQKHPNITDYYAGLFGQDVVSFQGENKTTMIWGTSAQFFDLASSRVEVGRPFTAEEDQSQARVTILGQSIKEKLFGDSDAVGERVKIGNKSFRVIGILAKQDSSMFFDLNSFAFVPLRTLQKQMLGVDYIQFLIAYMKDPSQAEATAADVTAIMREQHDITDPNKDDFAVTTMEEALGMLDAITGGINLLLMAIAAISLLVGGVGIMNVMYVSVSERTYEIGLRKSVGATKSDILWQFLWEALSLTFIGGVIGVILGQLLSVLSALAAQYYGIDWGFNISITGLILGVGFSVITGLIFGIYPARKASMMEPVEALRKQ